MCRAAFEGLSPANDEDDSDATAAERETMKCKRTKIVVSDAEYRSWLRAAEGM